MLQKCWIFVIFVSIFVVSNQCFAIQDGSEIITSADKYLIVSDILHQKPIIEPDSTRKKRCEESSTIFNGKKSSCRGDLIFHEEFDLIAGRDSPDDDYAAEDNFRLLNTSMWRRDIRIPQQPDYEFCVYHKLEKNIKIEDGKLKIIPTLTDDVFGEDATMFGRLQLSDCSSTSPSECSHNASSFMILPPIISSRLSTKETFKFRYGRIEIRAKFPKGDWLFPELQLKNANDGSSKVILALARGNDVLQKIDNNTGSSEEFGSKRVDFGVYKGANGISKDLKHSMKNLGLWSDDFHVYETIWSETGFVFRIDGQNVGEVEINGDSGDFDKEHYLLLGLGVGGIEVFPDGLTSGNYEKPWKNTAAKGMLRFWQAKDSWLPTWHLDSRQTAALEIDYVKIYAI